MRRTAFRRKEPPPSLARVRQWSGAAPTPRAPARAVLVVSRAFSPRPKEEPLQHLGYMALVRKLPCARCSTIAIPRQFCHADEGKGGMLKTDCRRGWPGCDACHYFVGSTGRMGKEGRREFEAYAAACTRLLIEVSGKWPKRLPRWPG